MSNGFTLPLYLARLSLKAMLLTMFGLALLVSLFDLVELMRRASGRTGVGFGDVLAIAGLRLPFLALEVLPFALLIGSMVAFWRLTRSSELVAIRSTGVSAWQFIAPAVAIAVLIGTVSVAVVNPLGAAMLARSERMDDALLKTGGGRMSLMGGELWVRQPDTVASEGGVAVLHGATARMQEGVLRLQDVTVFRLSRDDRLVGRIVAERAELGPTGWQLGPGWVVQQGSVPVRSPGSVMPTQLTPERIEESFAPPDTLGFWALPGFIGLLDASGFNSIRHRLHLHALLSLPLLAAGMAVLGAAFAMRPARRGRVAMMLASGLGAGFALYTLSRLAVEFGESGLLPVALAAWVPAVAGLLVGLGLLVQLEEA